MKKVDRFVVLISSCVLSSLNLQAQDTTTVDTVTTIPATDTTTTIVSDSLGKSPYYYELKKRFYKSEYDTLRIDKFGFTAKPSITFGAGLRMRRHKNKYPFAHEHSLIAYYGINRGSFSIEYQSIWNQVIGNWNLELNGKLFIPNSVFFFGVGNETTKNNDIKRKYYRLYSQEFLGSIAINRLINRMHFIEVSPFYQHVDIRLKENDFFTTYFPNLSPKDVERKHFIGASATYGYTKKNDPLSPTKGFVFSAAAAYTQNIKSTDNTDGNFMRYTSSAAVYLPISRVVTLAVRAGGALIDGEPEFFQLNRLGGNQNLRGFRRERFWGEESFFNNNELRFLWPTQNRHFDGKIGFLAFADQGRVWQPGEKSDIWHRGYGGGLVIQIFNQLLVNATYGISKEDRVLHLRLGFLF
ncbi:MAG TPA: hypothetical protein VD794_00900 [Flavisolibacter sp.]|nr:hypothetical protein [Flavisolibacter sp.]